MSTNDGGAAFPAFLEGHEGMNLRDWFAGMLLPTVAKEWDQCCDRPDTQLLIAQICYRYADAMLKAREEE